MTSAEKKIEIRRAQPLAWYYANKDLALATRTKRRVKMIELVRDYKVDRGCSKCDERHPACLDFHHPDPSTKEVSPGKLLKDKGWSFKRLKLEFDTLEVLCANCHRKVHARWREEGIEKEVSTSDKGLS